MSNYVVKYYRSNKDYVVTNIFNGGSMLLAPGGEYAPIRQSDVIKLNKSLIAKDIVKITNVDKLKARKLLKIDDFEIIKPSKKEKMRKDLIMKVSNEASSNLAFISSLDIFEFLSIFSNFAEMGIFITDTNQEEKYLEILSKGDENLIEELEKFLDVKDRLSRVKNFHEKLSKTIGKLSSADKIEEMEKIYNTYKGIH